MQDISDVFFPKFSINSNMTHKLSPARKLIYFLPEDLLTILY